ncbi:hypothetical protein DERP_007047 [Dermatophagoides pteronyssinus]|uniref:Uncharacterized protein n=1 Tax=Dermatophagoides pteronyssinus TaxID=6956 RepID=A0ABQ8JU50_DERPT|nr:hypothetical protein DERP_007047 [Dermatophagoides pteronyssinus]
MWKLIQGCIRSGNAANNGVSNKPGAIVITRIPCGAKSRAIGNVRLAIPTPAQLITASRRPNFFY